MPYAVTLLNLYADDNGDTRIAPMDIPLVLQDFAPPATPFNASFAQPATQYLVIRLPVGWVGEPHTSPKRQALFCLSGSLKVTCSTGQVAVINAGMGLLMSDVNGKGHKSEVMSAEPVNAIIIQ